MFMQMKGNNGKGIENSFVLAYFVRLVKIFSHLHIISFHIIYGSDLPSGFFSPRTDWVDSDNSLDSVLAAAFSGFK